MVNFGKSIEITKLYLSPLIMVIVLNCVVVEVVDAFVDRCLVKTYQEKGKKDGYGYRVENVLGYHISAFMVEIVIPIS